jgi:hypothetical protein
MTTILQVLRMQHSGSTDCSALLCMDTLSEACGEKICHMYTYTVSSTHVYS